MRVCFLFEQALRSIGFRAGSAEPRTRFNLGLGESSALGFNPAILDLNLRRFCSRRSLYQHRQHFTSSDVLTNARECAARDNASDRRSNDGAARRLRHKASRGIDLLRHLGFFNKRELQMNQPLLLHPKSHNAVRFAGLGFGFSLASRAGRPFPRRYAGG